MSELSFQDISDKLNRSLSSVKELLKDYTPVRITNTNKYYFSEEQLCVMLDELKYNYGQ